MNTLILLLSIPVLSLVQIFLSKRNSTLVGYLVPIISALVSAPYALGALEIVGPRLRPDYYQAAALMLPSIWYLLLFFAAYYYRRKN